VRRSRLWPQLRQALNVLGDRLEKPGKERLILTGTLSRVVNSQIVSSPARVILELPDRVRIEEQSGNQLRVIAFDGQNAWKAGGALNRADEEILESLLLDSAEHFFFSQMHGLATRFLGSRFRLDDGTASIYTDPFYDIYQITDQVPFGRATAGQPKLYYFNSDTQLLERVRYQIERDGSQIETEIQISDWRKVNGQQLPGRVARLENGREIVRLTINSAAAGQRVDDGIFVNPQSR